PQDAHYEELQQMEAELRSFRNTSGEAFTLVPVPLPDAIAENGGRLPATYANYLVLNRAVLLPTYDQPEKDELARRALQSVFPKYDIIPIDSRSLIRQHGSLHCATMQFPKGVLAAGRGGDNN
ncbi:MAG: agmatine deiminase family protein, partial [Alloprevotella sp.]|nr:agmatine deiminase family protein [Alloprevotella sp.]